MLQADPDEKVPPRPEIEDKFKPALGEGEEEGLEDEGETEEAPAAASEFAPEPKKANHRTIGVSYVGEDQLDHFSFYKIVETADGSFEVFDFGIDAIKTIIEPSARDVD